MGSREQPGEPRDVLPTVARVMGNRARRRSRHKRKKVRGPRAGAAVDITTLEHLFEQERYLEVIDRIGRVAPPQRTNAQWILLGNSLLRLHRYAESLGALRSVEPENQRSHRLEGYAYYGLSDYENARISFEKDLESFPTGLGHYLLAAAVAEGLDDHELTTDAKSRIVEHLRHAATFEDALEAGFEWFDDLLGWQPANVKDAVHMLEAGLARFPQSVGLRYRLAWRLLNGIHDPSAALSAIEPVTNQDNASNQALWLAHRAAFASGDTTGAVRFIARISEGHPTGVSIRIVEAELRIIGGDPDGALSILSEVLPDAEGTARMYGLLVRARSYFETGATELAMLDAVAAADIWFQDAAGNSSYALVDIGDGDAVEVDFGGTIVSVCESVLNTLSADRTLDVESEGHVHFLKAIHVADADASHHHLLIASQLCSHPIVSEYLVDYYRSVDDVEQMVYHHLSRCVRAFGSYRQDHEGGFTTSIAELPYPIESIRTKKARRSLHKIAIRSLKGASDVSEVEMVFLPFYRSFWKPLLLTKQLYSEAVEAAAALVGFMSDSVPALFDLAYALAANGNRDRAESMYRRLLTLDPHHVSALHNLALIQKQKGHFEEALRLSDQAFAHAPEDDVLRRLNESLHAHADEHNSARREEEEKRQKIREAFGIKTRPIVEVDSLPLDTAMYLLSLVRLGGSEDYGSVASLRALAGKLSPTLELDLEILRHLYRAGFIAVDERSSLSSFRFDEDDISFYLDSVRWHLNLGAGPHDCRVVIDVMERVLRDRAWPSAWHSQWRSLWELIALHECLDYLARKMESYSLPFSPGDRTKQLFSLLIEDYAVSQIYYFIWAACRDAAADVQAGKYPHARAAETVLGKIQRRSEKARTAGWEIARYNREYKSPPSTLFDTYFLGLLQIGEDGFNCCSRTYLLDLNREVQQPAGDE